MVSDFALHYEPNPYKPKSRYLSVEGYREYELLREKRCDYFHQLIKELNSEKLFNIRKGSNSILRINFKENQRFEDVICELIDIMEKLTPLIDEMVKIK